MTAMKTCSHCGVELEKNMNFCPLCGEPVMNANSDKKEYIQVRKRQQEEKLLTTFQKLTSSQKRKIFRQVSAIILVSGIFVTFIIDFIGNGTITWSKFSVAVCAVLLINTTLISFLHRKTLLFLLGSFTSTSALLVLFDIFTGTIGWGVKLGIPLLLAAYIIVFILIIIIKAARKQGLNIIAYSFIASGMLSLCTEGIISLYIENKLHFEWSVIVMASVLIVAAILLFIHYRLRKGMDLKRFFHI
jgi:hypothetical protein